MQQHIGAPCEPLVKKGDQVGVGQKIGDADAFVSAPVHSSVSGKVVAIEPYPHPLRRQVLSVVIEADKDDQRFEPKGPNDWFELSPDQIRQKIREAGLVGLGGAAFPTHVKLSPPKGKPIDTVIINGCECEPYLTCDHRLMLEQPGEIVEGARIILKAVKATKAYIGIESNKPDAIALMRKTAEPDIEVVVLKCKYPQGAEKQLIKAILDREVPSGGLPFDVGVLVQNVGTTRAIRDAVVEDKPLIERVITVTGSGIRYPANLRVRIGTLLSDLIEECGGVMNNPSKVIMGGPMMGLAQFTLDVPVIKGTSGVLVLSHEEAMLEEPKACISCAKCVDGCPAYLLPALLGKYAEKGRFEDCERYGVMDCIECGVCSYICPARRPLVQLIKLAKAEITKRQK